MEWSTIINQHLGTLIIAISVLAGIYIGWKQLKRVEKGQISSAYQNIINSSYELEKTYITYPDLYLAIKQTKQDIDTKKLTDEQRCRLDWITLMTLDFFDNLIYQKNRGVIKPGSKAWNTWERSIRQEFNRCPSLREMLNETRELYTDELICLAELCQD